MLKTKYLPIFFLAMLLGACNNYTPQKAPSKERAITKGEPKKDLSDTINIVAVGDIMLGTSYPTKATLPPDSGRNSFKAALKYLRNANVTFGNLEGSLLDTGAPVNYKLKFKHPPYLFRTPVSYAGLFKDAGFTMLSLGNNHSNDFDKAGRISTVKVLDSLGIYHAGLKSRPVATFTENGVRYGFCAFSPNGQTVSLLDIKGARKIVRELKDKSDIVIVSFHGGGEGIDFEHIAPKEEIFKGENRGNLRAFTHAAIDAGADVILGHGPHVSRGMELYKGKLIAYSLGNFCTYKSVSVAGVCGLAPLLKVSVNKKGYFISGKIISYRQTHYGGLVVDTMNSAARRIKSLTESDFMQPGIYISATGDIIPAAVD